MKTRRVGPVSALAIFFAVTFLLFFQAPSRCHAFEITIDVSPNVLNIESQGTIVTVHTDIAYSQVKGTSVYLNGVSIQYWKADARGYFVAKFEMDAIKKLDGLIIGDYNSLVLNGFTTNGVAFIGEQQIKVIDVLPKGQ
jgi:hypothetical protein